MLSDPTSIHIDGRSESVIIKNFPALKSRELLEGNRTDVAVSIEGFSPPIDGISEDVCQSNGPNNYPDFQWSMYVCPVSV